jgi:hypothetical protein
VAVVVLALGLDKGTQVLVLVGEKLMKHLLL